MSLISRKIMAYIINTILLIICFIYLSEKNIMTTDLVIYFIFAQVVLNTGSLLISNFLDKRLWVKNNIPNGKKSIENGGK